MKKRILAILLAIALLSSVAVVVAYAATTATCPKCGTTISGSNETECANNLNSHVSQCPYTQCPYCQKYFADKETVTKHESACPSNPANASDPITYECQKCGLVFENAADLQAHYDGMHKQDTNALKCPYCKYIAPNISAYNDHLAANHQKDGEQVTPRDNAERWFDKYVMGIGLNVDTNSFSSVVRVFAYVTEVFMSVFTDSGASEVFQIAGDSGVTYFFETIVPHFWAIFTA